MCIKKGQFVAIWNSEQVPEQHLLYEPIEPFSEEELISSRNIISEVYCIVIGS